MEEYYLDHSRQLLLPSYNHIIIYKILRIISLIMFHQYITIATKPKCLRLQTDSGCWPQEVNSTHQGSTDIMIAMNEIKYIVACQAHPALVKIGPVLVLTYPTDQLPILFQKRLNLNIGIFKCQLHGKNIMSILLGIYIPRLNDTSIDLREPQGF